ncbi:MAG: peptidase M22 [Eubacteriaceae bacterium]
MDKYFLGIDTSNYTTSLAVINENGKIINDIRIPLKVKLGKKGLRQSEAVFQHVQNLNKLSEQINNYGEKILAVASSTVPRIAVDSYMPVFNVSKNIGHLVSSLLGIPFHETSHQIGHIRNAIQFSQINTKNPFIALHLSGGTNEVLFVDVSDKKIDIEIIGETLDITAGQLIDRVGVDLGLNFPSGKIMEEIICQDDKDLIQLTYYFKEGNFSFSGVETYLKRQYRENKFDIKHICINVFNNVYKSIEKAILYHSNLYNTKDVLLLGGVMSNMYIKKNLLNSLSSSGINIHFCKDKYCGDNAVGVAFVAKDNYGEYI